MAGIPQAQPVGGVDQADVLLVVVEDLAGPDVPGLVIGVRIVLCQEAGRLRITGWAVELVVRWDEGAKR